SYTFIIKWHVPPVKVSHGSAMFDVPLVQSRLFHFTRITPSLLMIGKRRIRDRVYALTHRSGCLGYHCVSLAMLSYNKMGQAIFCYTNRSIKIPTAPVWHLCTGDFSLRSGYYRLGLRSRYWRHTL